MASRPVLDRGTARLELGISNPHTPRRVSGGTAGCCCASSFNWMMGKLAGRSREPASQPTGSCARKTRRKTWFGNGVSGVSNDRFIRLCTLQPNVWEVQTTMSEGSRIEGAADTALLVADVGVSLPPNVTYMNPSDSV